MLAITKIAMLVGWTAHATLGSPGSSLFWSLGSLGTHSDLSTHFWVHTFEYELSSFRGQTFEHKLLITHFWVQTVECKCLSTHFWVQMHGKMPWRFLGLTWLSFVVFCRLTWDSLETHFRLTSDSLGMEPFLFCIFTDLLAFLFYMFFPLPNYRFRFHCLVILGSIWDSFGMLFGEPGNLENGAPVYTGARFSRFGPPFFRLDF